ncbi:HD family phosphohydrolase [Betaproteobacteria bacterium]|nr:HD family phosphohydrolase [Betaproteobacteria bacterium]
MTEPNPEHIAALNRRFAQLGEHSGARALCTMLTHYRLHQPETPPKSAPDTLAPCASPLVPPVTPLLDAGKVQEAIARMPDLPPLIAELLKGFTHAEQLNISVVTQHLSTDQGLVLRILRIANSSFYGLSGQVKSLDDAIQILGLRAVYTLALNVAMMGALPQPPCAGFNLNYFWQHSVAVAITARELIGLHHQTPDTAFTNGLLHDIGQIILALCFPDEYQVMLDDENAHPAARYLVERAVLGIDHAQAGAMLARQWGLPEELSAAIAGHHAPPDDGSVDAMHLADVLAHALDKCPSGNRSIPHLDESAWTRLNLDEEHLFPVLTRLEGSFEETCKALLYG